MLRVYEAGLKYNYLREQMKKKLRESLNIEIKVEHHKWKEYKKYITVD